MVMFLNYSYSNIEATLEQFKLNIHYAFSMRQQCHRELETMRENHLGDRRLGLPHSRPHYRSEGSRHPTAGRFVGRGDLNAFVRPKIMMRVSA
jgi:hypothetical protein